MIKRPLMLVLLTSACGGTVAPQPELAPEPDTATVLGVPVPERSAPAEAEPSLEERWGAPFAVSSRGRPAPRPDRPHPVVAEPAAARPEAEPDVAPEDEDVEEEIEDEQAGDEDAPELETAPAGRAPDAEAEDAVARPGERRHRVEWGETWFGLARRYGVSAAALAARNPDVDPEGLRAGEVLVIPSGEAPEETRRTHTVVPGDSLWGISRRYDVPIERIREVNRLTGDRVRVGQILIIP